MNDRVLDMANQIAEETDTDILLINHPIMRGLDNKIISAVCCRKRRANLILILITSGGDPHAAFRISRALQRKYDNKFSALIPGYCKSAGTLLIIGASKLYMEELSELGPLDVQILKRDALEEYSSGLTVESAVQALQDMEFRLFNKFMQQIVKESGVLLTFKTAAETATALTLGIVQPIANKIEADRLGEDRRSMNIGKQYARRLDMVSNILTKYQGSNEMAMDVLTSGYPSHGFVIDAEEASMLFSNKVESYPGKFRLLVEELGQRAMWPLGDDDPSKGIWRFLNEEGDDAEANGAGGEPEGGEEQTDGAGPTSAGEGAGEQPPGGVSEPLPGNP